MLTTESSTTMSGIKDNETAVKASAADLSDFGAVYEKHYADVYRFIFRRICDTEKSFDLCSHVFLKAMENKDRYSDVGKPVVAWLYRIALNEIYMQHRKKKIEIVYHVDVNYLQNINSEIDNESNRELESRLLTALQKLDQSEMELIEMRYFDKQSVNMMAEVLNITPNNVSVKLFRVLEKLKKMLTSN